MPATARQPLKRSHRSNAVRKFSEGGSLTGVDIFKAGKFRGKTYTVADLQEMVRNFERFSSGPKPLVRVPAVIGHEEDQQFLQRSDLPAAGWWTRIYIEGDTLKGDCAEIPPPVARLLKGHAYRTVSAEIYDQPPEGVPGQGKMLRRVAFLGGELPQVKSLNDIPAVEEHRERGFRTTLVPCKLIRRLKAGSFVAFCEVRRMADETDDDIGTLEPADILKKLADMGFDTSVFDDLPDEMLGKVASEILRVYSSEKSPDDGDGGAPDEEAEHDHPDDEDGLEDDDGMDDEEDDDANPHQRHGRDDADMEEYDDDFDEDMEQFDQDPGEKAMWAKVDESGTARGAGGNYKPKRMAKKGWPPTKKKAAEACRAHADAEPVPTHDPTSPAEGRQPSKVTVNKTMHFRERGQQAKTTTHRQPTDRAPRLLSFAEVKKLVSAVVNEAKSEIKKELGGVKKHVSNYEADRKKASIEAFCEKNVKAGKILPAELDRDNPANLFDRLLRADAATPVRQFKEKGKTVALTELDLQMKEIEARPPRYFNERFQDPQGAAGSADSKEARKQWAEATYQKFSESFQATGVSKDVFVETTLQSSDTQYADIKKQWDNRGR